MCKTFCFLKESARYGCHIHKPTKPQVRLQRALSDGFRESRISPVTHSEPDLKNNWILCLHLSVTH